MISVLAVYSDGQVIEMATIGREGCTGVQAVFGAKSSSARYFAQIPGNSSQRRGHRGAHQGRCAGAAARRAYPAYSVLVIALFMAIGYGVWRVASWWLRWHISMNYPSD